MSHKCGSHTGKNIVLSNLKYKKKLKIYILVTIIFRFEISRACLEYILLPFLYFLWFFIRPFCKICLICNSVFNGNFMEKNSRIFIFIISCHKIFIMWLFVGFFRTYFYPFWMVIYELSFILIDSRRDLCTF